MLDRRLSTSRNVLRVAFGVVPIVAGADKFFHLLTNWEAYLSPLALRVLPFGAGTFLRAVGVVEIAVGVAVLTKWTRPAAYAASVWLSMIALNLLTTGQYFDVAVRDLVMSAGAYTLARLQEVKEAADARPAARTAPAAAAPARVGA